VKTFTSSIKEQYICPGEEKVIFERENYGVITHMWFGGNYQYFDKAIIRIYFDNAKKPSIEARMYMMHGIGFNDTDSFSTSMLGKTGKTGGIYNCFKIPFQNGIKITVQMDEKATEKDWFWSIVRGTDDIPVVIGGIALPKSAKLKLQKLEDYQAQPLEEFNIYNTKANNGAVFLVAMSAQSTSFEFRESCVRGYFNSNEPELLSSGLEDYFLGTYYFENGKYQNDLAGITHLVRNEEFSGYRFHVNDPLFFAVEFRLTCRCGEKIGYKVFHNPQTTLYTTYVWAYEW